MSPGVAADLAAAGERLSDALSLGLLAILQGLTEFLPVSSSGHLVLAQAALDFEGPAIRVGVALHLGTLAAVLVGYRRDLAALARGLTRGAAREILLLGLGTVPAALVGLLARDVLHGLFESVRSAALGLLATAAILTGGEVGRRRFVARALAAAAAGSPPRPHRMGARDALLIGCAQALAILPGISRSGSTIACGLALGLAPAAAARFSFLLAIPAILGAAVLELPDAFGEGAEGGAGGGALVVAAATAGLVGYGALRALLGVLGRGAFLWFAVYCGLLGALVLTLA